MSEHDEQCAVIQWADMQANVYPYVDRIFAIPNGGHRHKAVAAKMKAEGVRPGVLDLCLPVPLNGYHGMYIEMKYGKNNLTDNQRDWAMFLAEQGYYVCVCWNSTEAIDEIIKYYTSVKLA